MDRYQALKGVFSKSLELNKDALFFKKSVKILSQSLADKVDKRIAEDLRKLHLRINRFETNKLILQLEIKEERKLLNRVRLI
jgi:hypothetical protein